MRIRDDWNALVSIRSFQGTMNRADASAAKLSSGQRINRAGDDVSGFGMAQRIRKQFRSLLQANRNALDGLSMATTAEATLGEIGQLLHRGRELAVRASNGTMTEAARQSIQTETESILNEIDRVVDDTTYNGKPLFNPFGNASAVRAVVTGLRSGWLERAEDIVRTFYGLIGDSSPLSVVLHAHGVDAAWVEGTPDVNGKLKDLKLNINVKQFDTLNTPDGGSGPIFNDRKVARALTQAVLARNANFVSLDGWFISGSSDYIAGRDETLAKDVEKHGGKAVVEAMKDAMVGKWPDDSLHRSAAYLATKYIDKQLQDLGFAMTDFMQRLAWGDSLSTTLSGMIGLDTATFVNDFVANGEDFLATLDLNDADVGGINPGDASEVIPNGANLKISPLQHLQVKWPVRLSDIEMDVDLQIGTAAADKLRLEIPEVSTYSLNLLGIDLVNRPSEALELFSQALQGINATRTELGSLSNRLEHVLSSNGVSIENEQNSLSRIVDADYAKELSSMAKDQILVSSSGAMVAYSNTLREHVIQLLGGMGSTQSDSGEKK